MYKANATKVDDAIQSGDDNASLDRKTRSKSNKPYFRISKIDPIDGAFPPSHHASTIMNSSNINSQMLPQSSIPVVASVKPQFIRRNRANELGQEQPIADITSPEQNVTKQMKQKAGETLNSTGKHHLRMSFAGGFAMDLNTSKASAMISSTN